MKLMAELRGMATAALLGLVVLLLLVAAPPFLPGLDLLQSLRFHILALGLPLILVLVAAGAPWRGLITLLVVLAGAAQGAMPLVDNYQRRAEQGDSALGSLKLLSFNVLAANETPKAAVDFIIAQAPDIAIIMESPAIEPYLAEITAVLPYRLGCETRGLCDLTVFSRTPLSRSQMIAMPGRSQRLAVVETVVHGLPLTVVGMHLTKPYFDEAAYFELEQIKSVLAGIEGRLIVGGDFNAAPWSEAVADFASAASLAPPPWYPATWPVEFGPLGVPIDNLFTRGGALIEAIEAPVDSFGSNHRALLAEVSLRAASRP